MPRSTMSAAISSALREGSDSMTSPRALQTRRNSPMRGRRNVPCSRPSLRVPAAEMLASSPMRESLTALSLLAFAAGCIPSHRIVHEGNRYFEHCYGADFDVRVTPAQNLACWQAWIAHYNRFQPSQRVDYAMRRVE